MRLISIGTLVLVLGGCATSYQPEGFSGGFSETQLDKNVFRVTFRGNGYTRSERAEDLALLRSADLALSNGFKYFVIVTQDGRSSTAAFTTPTQSYTTATATGFGNAAYGSATTTTYGGQTFFVSRPSTSNTIICFVEKPNIQALVFDAEFLVGSLGRKYGVPGGRAR
jgi:hypothetical protein